MLREQCFDIEERPQKAQMGYDLAREVKHLPFIFGTVTTLGDIGHLILHEAGHAFQTFEMAHLPYLHQRSEYAVPMEFMEVASVTMECIGSMFLHQAGLCSKREEALLRIEMLEGTIMNGLPQIVAVDAFQHWVYEHPEQGAIQMPVGRRGGGYVNATFPAWIGVAMRREPAADGRLRMCMAIHFTISSMPTPLSALFRSGRTTCAILLRRFASTGRPWR